VTSAATPSGHNTERLELSLIAFDHSSASALIAGPAAAIATT
jgi:hypothetical protein